MVELKATPKVKLFGKGVLGIGIFKSTIKGKNCINYKKWLAMLDRCYSEKRIKMYPSYLNCSVSDEWLNFQVFSEWFVKNYNPEKMKGWHLDKDIIIKGNKIYSPETCCFVPPEINHAFRTFKNKNKEITGVYKIEESGNFKAQYFKTNLGTYPTKELAFNAYKNKKEEIVKALALKWKLEIDERAFKAMLDYKLEITG